MSSDPETEIRSRIKADDPSALELIYEHFADKLFGYLAAMLRSRTAAEDALQDLFVRFAEKRHKLAAARNLQAYLWQMTRNHAMSILRKRTYIETPTDQVEDWLPAPVDCTLADDELTIIRDSISELPDEQREVLILKIYQRCTFREIAERLDVPANTAASRYRYAIERLRALLGGVLAR